MTRRCVASLRRSPGVALRIVVDKASTAGELATLRAEYGRDDIELVLLDENLDFAGGVNRGAQRALWRGIADGFRGLPERRPAV